MNDHELAKYLAIEAGALLRELRGDISPTPLGVQPSYDHEALGKLGDRSANDFLLNSLRNHRPDDVILSEESLDPQLRHRASRVWIIDPLDGTSSFSRGFPGFAVHVALWERDSELPGSITAAAISVPLFDLHLSTADSAEQVASGTSFIRSSDVIQPKFSEGTIRIVTSPSRPPKMLERVVDSLAKQFSQDVEVQPLGSVGAKTAYIIAGAADIYLNTSGFHQWDIAAPIGVAAHYGLSSCLPTGRPHQMNGEGTEISGALIARPQFVEPILNSLA